MEVNNYSRTALVIEGILCLILGILAIALPIGTSFAITLILGWILIIGGIIHLIRTFRDGVHASSFWIALVGSLLAIVIGVLMLVYPLRGMMFLALILGIYFFFEGITEIALAVQFRKITPSWGLLLFSGIIALILSFIIWYNWPITAFWIIGVLLGINLILLGISLIACAASRRALL